jgi:hypothetical protein
MDEKILELVLNEILDAQVKTQKFQEDLLKRFKILEGWIQQVNSGPYSDINQEQLRLLKEIEKQINELGKQNKALPPQVIYEKRYQFFPSTNIREYYRIYSHIIKWLTVFILSCFLVKILRELLEKQGYL